MSCFPLEDGVRCAWAKSPGTFFSRVRCYASPIRKAGRAVSLAHKFDLASSAEPASGEHGEVANCIGGRVILSCGDVYAALVTAKRQAREGGGEQRWNFLSIMGKQTQEASNLRLVGTLTRLLAQGSNNSHSGTRAGPHMPHSPPKKMCGRAPSFGSAISDWENVVLNPLHSTPSHVSSCPLPHMRPT